MNNGVLIIGAGMGGIRTALDLAESRRRVTLIDKAFSIGGLMTQLDRTFPTNNCDLCTLSPHLSETGRQLHIDLLPMTQLIKIQGEAGNFKVTLESGPRYIDMGKCTACGECHQQFPGCVRFTPGLDHRAPTCMRYPQATPQAYSIDMARCQDPDALVQVCKHGAIIPEDKARVREMEVGAVVLAPGAGLFDPVILEPYGYGIYPNVVTGLEYERILSASGPTGGRLVRPSDGVPPRRIAWIQCVGSRSTQPPNVSYCSSACCMIALKEAVVTKERFQEDIETTIFYMDMRTFGKGYEEYFQRVQADCNLRMIRSRPHSVVPEGETGDLSITYTITGDPFPHRGRFDMVVLSTGFRIPADLVSLAGILGIELNGHDFARTGAFHPVETSRPGIYVCGLFEGPKDIPETMVQASAAACMAAKDLEPRKEITEDRKALPPERDVTKEAPRIGVFVCDCGENIGGVINAHDIADYAASLPSVVVSEMVGHGCSRESLNRIQEAIGQNKLNRVVIGGCSPRTHETLFQDILRRAGLNPYLVEMANIRDQNTWVHMDQPGVSTDKAKDLIRMAVSSAALSHPLMDHVLPMNRDVLVVGGGIAGMNAALCLADQGLKVYLVERSRELGGVSKALRKTLDGDDIGAYVRDLIARTTAHELIQVLPQAVIVDHTGMPGMFRTGVQVGPRMFYRQIRHGVTILATGALPHRPRQYLLDEHGAVLTQLDLEGVLEDQPERVRDWQQIVMIQCVGSRTPENPNCSRVCCQAAVKNALRILDVNPEAHVTVLYRDMRTYGFQEDYYRKARERGVTFVQYRREAGPRVAAHGERISVTYDEPILEREIQVSADAVALSTGLIADEEATEDLGMIFHLPRTSDGYFLEDHVKLRPLDLQVQGFFVAGTAHGPKNIRETIAQAQAAAGRAQTLLAKEQINLGAAVAKVDATRCAACLICVRACPFGIPFINADGCSEIDPSRCQGCGICAADCPAKAIQLMRYEDDQIMAKVEGLLGGLMG